MSGAVYRDLRRSSVLAVIPTKSNFVGLSQVVTDLIADPAVTTIAVACEVPEAENFVLNNFNDERILTIRTEEGRGIQHMWNAGMKQRPQSDHCLFINDDIELSPFAISSLAGYLDEHSDVGLVCPNYDGRSPGVDFVEVWDTCRGRYNGTGGLGGFCMMMAADLSNTWVFDERMIWWYGDDDVLNWVRSVGRKAGIVIESACRGNSSWTINNDPPQGFVQIVENDRLIFEQKWNK